MFSRDCIYDTTVRAAFILAAGEAGQQIDRLPMASELDHSDFRDSGRATSAKGLTLLAPPGMGMLREEENGGRGGIRTHGTVARTSDFESGAFNHSATLPSLE